MVKKKNLWYYKCNKLGCKCNRSAKKLNELFLEKLKSYALLEKYIEPVKDEFIRNFYENAKDSIEHLITLKARLIETTKKIEAMEERCAIGDLEKELYVKFIGKFRKERLDIGAEMNTLDFEKSNLTKRVEKYSQILCNLPQIWSYNGYKGKLELQELLFPNGLEYDREFDDYRTPEFNYVAFAMAQIERDLSKKDKGDFGVYSQKSPFVPGIGLEPIQSQ